MAAPFDSASTYYRILTGDPADAAAPGYGCHISLTRIVLMSIISMGIYWLYWMYRTWAQYRDHTAGDADQVGQTHYPVWHGLTQLLPVYGWFRFHAHVRLYKAVVQERGIADRLNPGWLVTIAIINFIASIVAGSMRSPLDVETANAAVIIIGYLITLITILVLAGILGWIQSNLNQYWLAVGGVPAQNARFGKGEAACIIIGILFWIGTIADFVFWEY